ncbi:hypothetical protein EDC04DRAFT_1845561 [Pisolithus marmoratus]|nr:hypothetical protein EDC04DRAFT_1845561 [Pisolithus marmoratus]
MRTLGIDPDAAAYCSMVFRISGNERLLARMHNQDDLAVAHHIGYTHLALHQPKGISLPANEQFGQLLKTLSIRHAGKHLVITVIQCSDFYTVDNDGKRRDPGDGLVSASVDRSAEAGTLTPLYAIASPQVWRRHLACVQRREQFKSIREHFYALMNMHQPTGTEANHKSVNKWKRDEAIGFFSDLFILKYLRNYMGEITLFERLPSMIETVSLSEGSVGTGEDDSLLAHPPKLMYTNWVMMYNLFIGRQQPNAEGLHPEVALPLWRSRYQNLCAEHDAPRRYADEKEKVAYEVKSMLQTLCSGLPDHIEKTLWNAYREHASSTRVTCQASNIDYDRQLDIPSMVQEIKTLQAKLDETEDEDEQRALEEDITGKILWLCWCGICAEVDELLPKVVDCVRREGNMEGFREIHLATISAMSAEPGLEDDQGHLQRIMLDAGAKTSKYELLLAARGAEQAKWTGTNRGTPAIDNHGTTPSASSRTPPTSAV